jgi:hypothetical protein
MEVGDKHEIDVIQTVKPNMTLTYHKPTVLCSIGTGGRLSLHSNAPTMPGHRHQQGSSKREGS